MINSNISLSICIPTYNRFSLLQDSVNSIINSIRLSGYDVSIIISDNCSSDDTQSYCLELVNTYPLIEYYRNDENVNELNFYIAAQRAKSEYVWLFSDDDILCSNAVKLVCDALASGNNLIVANYDLYDNDLNVCKKRNYFSINKDLKFEDKNQLLIELNLKVGFISCIVFKREAFLEMPIDEFDKYRSYGFPFVFALYSSLDNDLSALVISESIILQRGANHPADINWWYKCFVEGSSKIFDELIFSGYVPSAIRQAKYSVFKDYIISDLVWRKINKQNTIVPFNRIFKYYKIFPLAVLISLLIIFTPNFLIKSLVKIKHIIT
jgi:glycosyltransferase involved in cell wall biosynthesis